MFYVYGLIDSSNNKCFYVGKGSNARMYYHAQKVKRGATTDNPHLDHKIAKMLQNKIEIRYIKFYDNISCENEAYLLEEAKTREIGLANLCNAWHGGKGGRVPSDETRKRISENRKGIPVSDETRLKLSKAHLGKRLTDEAKAKKSNALRGKPQTVVQRQANERRGQSLRGRKFSDEHKQKLRSAKLKKPVKYWYGRQLTSDHKMKIRESVLDTLEKKREQLDG